MSQFDSLLDFEDTGTTNPPKQQTTDTADPFDPFGAPDSNVNANGGGGGDLLDLGFDMQVGCQSLLFLDRLDYCVIIKHTHAICSCKN